jgi:hypothetical protein
MGRMERGEETYTTPLTLAAAIAFLAAAAVAVATAAHG